MSFIAEDPMIAGDGRVSVHVAEYCTPAMIRHELSAAGDEEEIHNVIVLISSKIVLEQRCLELPTIVKRKFACGTIAACDTLDASLSILK